MSQIWLVQSAVRTSPTSSRRSEPRSRYIIQVINFGLCRKECQRTSNFAWLRTTTRMAAIHAKKNVRQSITSLRLGEAVEFFSFDQNHIRLAQKLEITSLHLHCRAGCDVNAVFHSAASDKCNASKWFGLNGNYKMLERQRVRLGIEILAVDGSHRSDSMEKKRTQNKSEQKWIFFLAA